MALLVFKIHAFNILLMAVLAITASSQKKLVSHVDVASNAHAVKEELERLVNAWSMVIEVLVVSMMGSVAGLALVYLAEHYELDLSKAFHTVNGSVIALSCLGFVLFRHCYSRFSI